MPSHTARAVTAGCVIPCGCGAAVEGNDAARSCGRFCLAGHCCVRRHDSARANPVSMLIVREQWHSVRNVLMPNAAAQAAAQWTTTPPNAHRQGDDGRVRPPVPMRQPFARPRTSRSLSGAPARVMLRRRAVRSLVQHAARVQRGRSAITTPGGTADCTRSPPSFDARSPRLTPQHCSAPRRLGIEHRERHYAVIAGMRRRRMSSRTTRQRRLWRLRLLQALGFDGHV
jgi:hypothetical protein